MCGWTKLSENMEEEVLDKYKVEEAKKGASKQCGDPLEWRIVKQDKIDQPRRWSGDCCARVFSRLENAVCSETKVSGGNRRGGDRAAAKNDDCGRHDEEDERERQIGREKHMVGQWIACSWL